MIWANPCVIWIYSYHINSVLKREKYNGKPPKPLSTESNDSYYFSQLLCVLGLVSSAGHILLCSLLKLKVVFVAKMFQDLSLNVHNCMWTKSVECKLVWNYTCDFKIKQARSASLIQNHKYYFTPKLHDMKFNCHFIRSILKSHNFNALNVRFWCLQNDVLWQKFIQAQQRSKQLWSQNKNSLLLMPKSSILVAWINDGGLPIFCGWERDLA